MIYVRLDDSNTVVEVSGEERELPFVCVNDDDVSVDLKSLMYRAIYVENGMLRRRDIKLPYYEQRIAEYPPIGDQLDALWKLIKANADKIDLTEAAPLLEAVQAVKDKYPKPPTNGIN